MERVAPPKRIPEYWNSQHFHLGHQEIPKFSYLARPPSRTGLSFNIHDILEIPRNLRYFQEAGRRTQILRSESPPRARRPPKAASESCARTRRANTRAHARVGVRGALRALKCTSYARPARSKKIQFPENRPKAIRWTSGHDPIYVCIYTYIYIYGRGRLYVSTNDQLH